MQLTVINGSPRHKKSNTKVYLDHFVDGFSSVSGNRFETHFVYPFKNKDHMVNVFADAEIVLLGFPLYVDSIPSETLRFLNSLKPLKGRSGNPDIMFFVQNGFPEAFHSRPVEKYLLKLAKRLNCNCLGSFIKGMGNGIQEMPLKMTKSVRALFTDLGASFGKTRQLDAKLVKKIAGMERLGPVIRFLINTSIGNKLTNFYWNSEMKRIGTLDNAWNRPDEKL